MIGHPPEVAPDLSRFLDDIVAGNLHDPVTGNFQSGKHPHGRRFTGPIGTDKTNHLSGFNREGNPVNRAHPPFEDANQPGDFNDRLAQNDPSRFGSPM